MLEKLQKILTAYKDLEAKLGDPQVLAIKKNIIDLLRILPIRGLLLLGPCFIRESAD